MKAMIGESMNWKTIGCLGRNKNSNNRKITGASSFGWSVFLFWGDGNLFGWKSEMLLFLGRKSYCFFLKIQGICFLSSENGNINSWFLESFLLGMKLKVHK